MSQSNEALAAEQPVEQEEQQQPEPQGLMETQPRNVSQETSEEDKEPISHLEGEETEEDEKYERPDWFPEKFWEEDGPDLEKMAQSYTELEKKFSQGKHKAPDNYDTEVLSKAGIGEDDELATFFNSWAKENGVSQAAYESMIGKVLEMGGAQSQQAQFTVEQEKKTLGANADEIIKSNIQWADSLERKGIISEEERDEIDIWGGTAAGQRLMQKVRAMTGDMVSIPTTTASMDLKQSEEDFKVAMQTKMSDPRYGTDQAYTRSVEREFEERYK